MVTRNLYSIKNFYTALASPIANFLTKVVENSSHSSHRVRTVKKRNFNKNFSKESDITKEIIYIFDVIVIVIIMPKSHLLEWKKT